MDDSLGLNELNDDEDKLLPDTTDDDDAEYTSEGGSVEGNWNFTIPFRCWESSSDATSTYVPAPARRKNLLIGISVAIIVMIVLASSVTSIVYTQKEFVNSNFTTEELDKDVKTIDKKVGELETSVKSNGNAIKEEETKVKQKDKEFENLITKNHDDIKNINDEINKLIHGNAATAASASPTLLTAMALAINIWL